jgi:hypothetical protein
MSDILEIIISELSTQSDTFICTNLLKTALTLMHPVDNKIQMPIIEATCSFAKNKIEKSKPV